MGLFLLGYRYLGRLMYIFAEILVYLSTVSLLLTHNLRCPPVEIII